MGRGRIPVTSYSEMPARGRAEAHERTAGRRKVVRAERIDTVKTTPAETNRWRHVLIGECGHVLDGPFISYAEEPPDRWRYAVEHRQRMTCFDDACKSSPLSLTRVRAAGS